MSGNKATSTNKGSVDSSPSQSSCEVVTTTQDILSSECIDEPGNALPAMDCWSKDSSTKISDDYISLSGIACLFVIV